MALLTRLNGWQETIAPYVNMFVIFFLIMFIGFLVGKIASRLLYKFLHDIGTDAHIKRLTKTSIAFTTIASRSVAGIIYAITVILALNSIGITTVLLEGILLIVIVVVLLSVLVSLKDVIPNASAGMTLRAQLKVGNQIKIDDIEGTIKELKLLETSIETANGDLIIIPNALFSRKSVTIKRQK